MQNFFCGACELRAGYGFTTSTCDVPRTSTSVPRYYDVAIDGPKIKPATPWTTEFIVLYKKIKFYIKSLFHWDFIQWFACRQCCRACVWCNVISVWHLGEHNTAVGCYYSTCWVLKSWWEHQHNYASLPRVFTCWHASSWIKLMKGKALRKHNLHEKTAASVLLKPFISVRH